MPRELTPEVRKKLGLARIDERPYRWGFAAIVVACASVPLLFAGYQRAVLVVMVGGFALVPLARWFERRDLERSERVFTHGEEAIGRVLDVEPPGPANNERSVRIAFLVGDAKVETSVRGCPLARRGLGPDDGVRVLYCAEEPQRCLIVEKTGAPPRNAL